MSLLEWRRHSAHDSGSVHLLVVVIELVDQVCKSVVLYDVLLVYCFCHVDHSLYQRTYYQIIA